MILCRPERASSGEQLRLLRKSFPQWCRFLPHNSCSGCACPERCCEGGPTPVPTSLTESWSARGSSRVPPLVEGGLNICRTFCSSIQYCPWMERHWCSERPSSSVWVAVEVTVAGVSQSHRRAPRRRGLQSAPHGAGPRLPRSSLEGPDVCHWSLCYSPSRSLAWPAPIFPCLGVCRLSLLTGLVCPFPSSARPPAVVRCGVLCLFCKLRAPERAQATSRLPCCTAEEAGHPVLMEIAPRRGQTLGW